MNEQIQKEHGERGLNSTKARHFIGWHILGGYLRLTSATSKFVYDPPDAEQKCADLMPAIYVCWHGQGMLGMKLVPEAKQLTILTSRHPDGQLVAAAAKSFGCSNIDGSGANPKQDEGTGGMAAMREMLRAMKNGQSIGITADIPPVPGRQVSDGVALLARFSGRPIIPYAVSSSRRSVLEKVWDKMQINHPFSTISAVVDEPLYVPRSAKDLTPYSNELAKRLDNVLDRAFLLADGKDLPPRPDRSAFSVTED